MFVLCRPNHTPVTACELCPVVGTLHCRDERITLYSSLRQFAIIPVTRKMWQHSGGCLKLTNHSTFMSIRTHTLGQLSLF